MIYCGWNKSKNALFKGKGWNALAVVAAVTGNGDRKLPLYWNVWEGSVRQMIRKPEDLTECFSNLLRL